MGEMPKDCTGLELLNPEGNFEKHNCKWVNWKTRSKKAKRNKDTTIATFTLSTDHYNYLSKLAVMKSKETGKRYTLSQFIRELLERHAPNPKTHDMFGGKK
jgi:hypothetical protein